MFEKYGKSVADIRTAKRNFFEDNDELVVAQNKCAEIYEKQPERTKCKNCNYDLSDGTRYESHNVSYVICNKCGHVQGLFEETEAYCDFLYTGSKYGKYMYAADDEKEKYDQRVRNIYKPKAEFLIEVLKSRGVNTDQLQVLDIGAGSGYFLSACDDLGITASGVDVSSEQVCYGNDFMHKHNGASLKYISGGGALEMVISESNANVMSAIGVLEHLTNYHSVLDAAKNNANIHYLYIMVPMFGLSNVLETLTPDVYNRHLGGPHTHVFSMESLMCLCEMYDMTMVGKWQFGTDMMDLYRMCVVKNNSDFGDVIHEKFWQCLDEMQMVLDKHDFCSEIHAVFEFNNR